MDLQKLIMLLAVVLLSVSVLICITLGQRTEHKAKTDVEHEIAACHLFDLIVDATGRGRGGGG